MAGLVKVGEFLGFGFMLLFGVVWTAIAVYIFTRSRKSASWPEAVGKVLFTEVRRVDTVTSSARTGSLTYQPYIKYEYSVGGSRYENAAYSVAARAWTADPAPAADILTRYPVGGDVPVFYDPSNPRDSALIPGDSGGNWYFLALGGVFITVGVVGLLGLL
jgi:hypothetical protein